MAVQTLHNYRDSGERVVDGAAHAQLAVHAAVSGGGCGEENARNQFVRLEVATVFSVAGVEVGELPAADSAGAGDFEDRAVGFDQFAAGRLQAAAQTSTR